MTEPPRRLAGQWTPAELGVHQVIGGGPMPAYIRRPHDDRLRAALNPAIEDSRLVVIRGDALTGTLTRPAFQSELEHRVARHEASGRDWMLYLNVDRLHLVNLHHGFRVGDALLGWVGRLTAARLPAPALVGRLGGDLFAAFVPATGEREARQCAETLRAQV